MCRNQLEEKEMYSCQELQESCQEERIHSRKMCLKFNQLIYWENNTYCLHIVQIQIIKLLSNSKSCRGPISA